MAKNQYFKFSVVMAIYNTGEFLRPAIDSVINQSIGFEENIQLILVDDGSTDNSKEICLQYQKTYPDNIEVISQENSGQASARNNGIKHVKGEYVNFLDSDDCISENAFEDVYEFFQDHDSEIDLVAIPMKFFGRKTSSHMLNPKFSETRVVDLVEEPNYPQLSSSSAFFKKDVLKKYTFPTNVSFSEDSILINKLLLEKKKYGLVNTAMYYYRKREDTASTMDNVDTKKEYFTDKLKYYYLELINYALEKEGEVPNFLQYTLAYDLQWMLKQPNLDVLETEEEKDEFWDYLNQVTSYIRDSAIIHNRFVTNTNFLPFFLHFKTKDLHVECRDGDVFFKTNTYQIDSLARHNLWMDIVAIKDGVLTLAGLLHTNFDNQNMSFEAIKEKNGEKESFIAKYVKYTPREDTTYLDVPWRFKYNFEFKIPITDCEEFKLKIKTNYHKDGDATNFSKDNVASVFNEIKFSNHARMSEISNYLIKDGLMVVFDNNLFHIRPYAFKSMIKRELCVIFKILKSNKEFSGRAFGLRLLYLFAYLFFKRKNDIYLFMDRENVADDNAMHLFRYAQNIDDGIEKYFVLEKDSKDYKAMQKIGNVLGYKSLKHKLYYLFADKIISTHPYETVLNPFFVYGEDERPFYAGLLTHQLYFLQHGVTKDNISGWLTKYDKNLSLIVTVSEKERESFFDEGYTFDEDVVQVLGFPRYDNLKNDNVKKEILIIPTWRKYLRGNREAFLHSEYFKSLNSMLSSEKLIELADKFGYRIIFKPHPELDQYMGDSDERYRDLLDINENIKLSTEESYQELLNNAALLITDYSSVFFDFAYLKKPLIYYRARDDYHYEENYFDYETMGFGDVIEDTDDLFDKISKYLESDCKMEEKYQKRVDEFFKFNDRNNCKRVYEWIKKD
ncbi:MAG: glycosyltransferase [Methanobrevibacter thaueri]|nr:glycosyltransferase [Methanobrevibacter thaueri]